MPIKKKEVETESEKRFGAELQDKKKTENMNDFFKLKGSPINDVAIDPADFFTIYEEPKEEKPKSTKKKENQAQKTEKSKKESLKKQNTQKNFEGLKFLVDSMKEENQTDLNAKKDKKKKETVQKDFKDFAEVLKKESKPKIKKDEVTIYKATPQDINIVVELQEYAGDWYTKESKETLLTMLNNQNYHAFIGKVDDVPFGWVASFIGKCPTEFQEMYSLIPIKKTTAILDAIIVKPEFQGRGLGKILHGEIEKKVINKGCMEAYASVKCQNLPSINNLIKHTYIIKNFIDDKFGIRYIMYKKFTFF